MTALFQLALALVVIGGAVGGWLGRWPGAVGGACIGLGALIVTIVLMGKD